MAAKETSGELKIIRIAGTDIYGDKKVLQGLIRIKGISHMFANAISKILELDPSKKFEDLTDAEVKKLNDILENASKYDIPHWMLNRRKDFETGQDSHLVSVDVDLTKKMDIRRLQEVRNRRGIRHSLGLKVRGQRLASNARKGKSVGVKKKKAPKKAGK